MANIIIPSCLDKKVEKRVKIGHRFSDYSPLYLSKEEVDFMSTHFLSRLKDGLTLIKEEYGIIDLCLAEYKLEVLICTHGAKGREIDQQHLINPSKISAVVV